jgi:NADPH-dependent glutamate synthase beta subunit-like oxidoreductase/2,4-dienoyl-CoA reductase-like NADH-dependent reductase (Old Yellow Enzyme family)
VSSASRHEKFNFRSLEEVVAKAAELGLDLPVSRNLSLLTQPVTVGRRRATPGHLGRERSTKPFSDAGRRRQAAAGHEKRSFPNALAVHPMEGCDGTSDGRPDELTFRRYRRFAAGGAGLLWMEATAVVQEGRANPRQLWLHEGSLADFARLAEETRRAARGALGPNHEPALVAQLTHSGRYSKPDGKARPIIAHHSAVLDPQHGLPPGYPLIGDDELRRLIDTYVQAAKLAEQAGFDGVDIKSCHRYLVAELLASFTREGSDFGGDFESRTRFLRTVAQRVREEVPGLLLCCRLNAYDAIPYPFGFGVDREDATRSDLTEPLALAGRLRGLGLDLLNVSIANPYYNPHYGRPYDEPVAGGYVPDEHPLAGIARLIHITGEVQEAYPDLPIVGTGYTWLREFAPYVAAGVLERGWASIVGFGRGAFAMPHFARSIMEKGALDPHEVCITCSSCTQIMRDGGRTGCVVRDGDIYGAIFLEGRLRDPAVVRELAEDCRECIAPTCAQGCPAHVHVPEFIAAIADGNDRRAYDILRQDNPLPEICAYACPAEVQCEGACIQRHLQGKSIPIRALQRYVSERAREEGWAELPVPDATSGKRIAVVGGGPAGLACAAELLRLGHEATIFDAASEAGGTARALIPPERLSDDVARGEIEAVFRGRAADRLTWRRGGGLRRGFNLDDVLALGFDAVFLALGLGESLPLPGKARPSEGLTDALSFLRRAKQGLYRTMPERVAVLGGGNTAMDAATTAKRLGARDVYLVYRRSFAELPAWPEERDRALRAGVHFLILTQPVDYVTDERGRLTGLRIARTVLGEPDASSRRRPEVVAGSESTLAVDMVVEALGQRPASDLAQLLPGVELTSDGLVKVDPETLATSRARVYAGGDITNGGDTAARAIADGLSAARHIDAYLTLVFHTPPPKVVT